MDLGLIEVNNVLRVVDIWDVERWCKAWIPGIVCSEAVGEAAIPLESFHSMVKLEINMLGRILSTVFVNANQNINLSAISDRKEVSSNSWTEVNHWSDSFYLRNCCLKSAHVCQKSWRLHLPWNYQSRYWVPGFTSMRIKRSNVIEVIARWLTTIVQLEKWTSSISSGFLNLHRFYLYGWLYSLPGLIQLDDVHFH